MTADLVSWLREQIAEDRRLAEVIPERHRSWQGDGASVIAGHPTDQVLDFAWFDASDHIATWSPARVLAECDAKLAILNLDRHLTDIPFVGAAVLRFLALPYSDRPGYREEWKLQG